MDFSLPDETQELIRRVEEFVARELTPLEPAFLSQPFRSLLPVLDEKRALAKELGLWAPGHPRALGGMGLGLVELGLFSEALGGCPFGHYVFGCQAPDAGNAEILHRYASDELRQSYLQPLIDGTIRSCFSMTEVDLPGSNPVMLETSAVRDGDHYVINGHKWFTTSADGAAFAIVMAVTHPEAEPHRRASMILVPTETPGFEWVRNISVMGEAGEDWPSHAEVRYRDCRVPVGHRIGPEGHGFVIAQERLGPGRIHHCMRWLGICKRALDLLCRRAATRTIAPGKVLGERETVQVWIAESAAEIEAARLLTLHTAWKIDHQGWRQARQDISMIKFLVAGTLLRVLDRAIQAHGALGMTDDTVLAYFYRHERGARIYDGPDEVHKLSLARRILRPYRTQDTSTPHRHQP